MTQALKQIHLEYSKFEGKRDVREIIKSVKARTLAGCRIMFSGVPRDLIVKLTAIVKALGGEVSTNEEDLPSNTSITPLITHLIVVERGKYNTKKVHDARQYNGKVKVLHGSWLKLAESTWTLPDESKFDLARFPYDPEDGKVAAQIDYWEYVSKD
jgi:hypothetical protein